MKPTLTRRIFNRIYESVRKKRVLFVGVADYNKEQIKWLQENNVEVWTIDNDMDRNKHPERYGINPKRHIWASVQNIDEHFNENYFDVIFCLGVAGYGLNKIDNLLKAFCGMKRVLKEDGSIIFTLTKGHEVVA
jgi:ubiquinone/menaquinone biosynthesis C-methylase UbiE